MKRFGMNTEEQKWLWLVLVLVVFGFWFLVTIARGGVGNSHILIQHSAEFGVRLLLIKIRRNAPS